MLTRWFYPEVHLVATNLVPIETRSKVAAGPLASGDFQVTLSHVVTLKPCAFHFIYSNVDATQAPISIKPFWSSSWVNTLTWSSLNEYYPLHIIMWSYWFINLNFAGSSLLPCSIGAKSLLKLPRHMRFVSSKPPTFPSHLQPVHQRKALSQSSPSSHKTLCHVSYEMNSFITLYENSINTWSFILHGTCCSY